MTRTMKTKSSTGRRNSSYTLSSSLRLFLGLLGFCCSLTVLFFCMKAVMAVGGFCAEGGPYQIRVPCPEGINVLMPVSVFGLFIFGALAISATIWRGAYLIILMWSSLFLSLGWNFFEFGLNPPDGQDAVISWLICGVMFVAMGGLPLFFLMRASRKSHEVKRGFFTRILGFFLHMIPVAAGIILGIRVYNHFT